LFPEALLISIPSTRFRSRIHRATLRLTQAVILAVVAILALPAHAGEAREIVSRASATYPEIAKRMKISGEVKVEATVDAAGKVSDAKAISGNKMLAAAAEDAVRKYKFAPGSETSTVHVDVNFALNM
jgi:TonB family protein